MKDVTPQRLLLIDPDTQSLVLDLQVNISRNIIENGHHVLTAEDYQDVTDVIQEHIGIPDLDATNLAAFLGLHKALTAGIVAFNAKDTEVRSQITNAVAQFCIGTDWTEDDRIKTLIAKQWHLIWRT